MFLKKAAYVFLETSAAFVEGLMKDLKEIKIFTEENERRVEPKSKYIRPQLVIGLDVFLRI